MHPIQPTHRKATWWLAALVGSLALMLAAPAISRAEESNPNNYTCAGKISGGSPEAGSEEQQVKYKFFCNGPITGYQVQSQIPVTGIQSPPLVSGSTGTTPLTDTFSCSGELPGYAVNCVGATKGAYETITGQFAIGTKLCAEPRVDPLLTVTYAYLEKGVVTQAISGPFDLGRPYDCKWDKQSADGTRLDPAEPKHGHAKGKKAKKAAGRSK